MLTADRGRPIAAPVDRPRITLLIPARNEERNIAWVLRRVSPSVDEVIVIDGRSTDRTLEIVKLVRPDARIVTEIGRGKGAAIRTGIGAASGQVIVMIDADGSMDPVEIDRYLEPIAAGADLAKGSRFMLGGGTTDITYTRMIGNRALLALTNLLYGSRHTELCYGFMAFRTDSVRALGLVADGFEIETEIVVRASLANLDVVEVPSQEAARLNGESNLNAVRDGLRILRTIVGLRLGPSRSRPSRPARSPSIGAARLVPMTILGILAIAAAVVSLGQ